MTSRLKLRKKKWRPPNEETEQGGKPGQSVDGNDMNAVRTGHATTDMMSKPKQIQNKHNKTQKMLTPKSIIQKAISSADKHGIKLEPGRENEGYGNCSNI